MTGPAIFVQCGTTNTRALFVGDGGSGVRGEKQWPGVGELGPDQFESTLFDHAADWLRSAPDARIFLNGMAGSTIGWRPAPYVECPADAASIAGAAQHFVARGRKVVVLPGVTGPNGFGERDVMRGEETEIVGVPDRGASLICIPGTHTKWVRMHESRIHALHTSVTGELFALLIRHSVLARGAARETLDESAYEEGLEAGLGAQGARVLHAMFAARLRQVLDGGTPEQAAGYLSGLLIGADVSGMQAIAPHWFSRERRIVVIGAEGLAPRFAAALERAGFRSDVVDSASAARAGFAILAELVQ